VFDLDPVPELVGPQSPPVLGALERLLTIQPSPEHGVRHVFLEETLRDFTVVCQDLDRAESEYQAQVLESFEESAAALSSVRARLINYFHHGYSLLDAIADIAIGKPTAKPWIQYAESLEGDSDLEALPLARILTFRLREPRHIIAAHRKGWRAPVLLIGAGSASMSRVPFETPPPDPDVVAAMLRAYESVGLDQPRNPSEQVAIAATALGARAPRCDVTVRLLYSKLVNSYGIQTAPVSRITPAIVALLSRVIDTSLVSAARAGTS
jgi:hypothetical protein